MLGIYVEFTHPGVVFPGVVGALCLLLFAISAQVLPVSTIGVLLIVLALVMFILEIKVTSFGMLTLGGAAALVIGSLDAHRRTDPRVAGADGIRAAVGPDDHADVCLRRPARDPRPADRGS